MQHDIFITYANHPLYNEPDNIYPIIDTIKENLPNLYSKGLRIAAELYVKSVKEGRRDVFQEYYETETASNPELLGSLDHVFLEDLGRDVYDFVGLDGSEKCGCMSFHFRDMLYQTLMTPEPPMPKDKGEKRRHGVKISSCTGIKYIQRSAAPENKRAPKPSPLEVWRKKGLNCVVCDQAYAIYVIHALSLGIEFNNILGFVEYLNKGRELLRTDIELDKGLKDRPYNVGLKEHTYWRTDRLSSFRGVITGAVVHSILSFLLDAGWEKNRRKLKRCQMCGIFFVAKKDNPRQIKCRVCSRKSTLTSEQKAANQRERRRRKREEKDLKESMIREADIRQRMKGSGLTREEAEDQYEYDKQIDKEV